MSGLKEAWYEFVSQKKSPENWAALISFGGLPDDRGMGGAGREVDGTPIAKATTILAIQRPNHNSLKTKNEGRILYQNFIIFGIAIRAN